MLQAMGMISVRDYAKHRGCSPAAVSKAIKQGRLEKSITRDKLGHPKIVDPVKADQEWERNTAPRPEAEPEPKPKPRATAKEKAPEAPVEPVDTSGVPSYADSRARAEAAKAGLQTLKLMEERGALVRVDGVRAEVSSKFSEIRAKLLGVASRLLQRSPTITKADADLAHELIREALEAIADGISTN